MTERKPIPAKLLQRIKAVTNKRARYVLDAIVKNGSISTIQLKEAGYDHPPRAARDAVELGFALTRIKAKRSDGQTIAAYVFDERELDPKSDRTSRSCEEGARRDHQAQGCQMQPVRSRSQHPS